MNAGLRKPYKIAVTGGPGGGKTTALDLFNREFTNDVVIVPEAATMLFQGGVKRSQDLDVIGQTQKTIYNLQQNLETLFQKKYPNHLLMCDRGTLDGAAYWPHSSQNFFDMLGTTIEQELACYDAVIFFETAAANGNAIDSNNPYRTEDKIQAIELDRELQSLWSQHRNYHFVPSNESFLKKVMFGIMTINNVISKERQKEV